MKKILCFGDSNTYGYNPKDGSRYGLGVRWTSILSEKLDGYEVIEEGLCGRTTIFDDLYREGRRGTQTFPDILKEHKLLDTIIIMLGTNDCKTAYGADAQIIGEGILEIIGQAREYSPLSKILLVSPIYLGERVYEEGFDEEFSKDSIDVSKSLEIVYERISKENNLEFMRAEDYASCSEIDQEHMNEQGHRKLGEAIYKKLINEVL